MLIETVPPADIHWFSNQFIDACEQLKLQLELSANETNTEESVDRLSRAMSQLIEVLLTYDRDPDVLHLSEEHHLCPPKIGDLGDYGLSILESLCHLSLEMELELDSHQWEQLSISLALWGIHHGAELSSFTLISNGLAHMANKATTLQHLESLYLTMSATIDAAAVDTIEEALFTNSSHPWKLLLYNRAIVATRSLSSTYIREAFSAIVEHLPEEASDFFSDGLIQLQEKAFPVETQRLVAEFYQNSKKPILH